MYYQGVSSVIQIGEKVKSKRYEYEIKEVINVGLANTYLAINSKGKEVFLKQFKKNDKDFIKAQKDIFRYIRSIHEQDKSLDKLLEYSLEQFIYKDYFFEVKSKVNGNNLEDYLFDEVRDFKTRVKLAKQLIYIIAKLHNYGIIHSDLKFEQFMIVKDKFLKLIDFSNIIIENKVYLPAGTPGYKSPEHIKKEKITKKSDIFTLGILVYTLLTYRHPFSELLEDGSYDEKLLTSTFTPLYKLNPSFPYRLSQTISNALSFEPEKRPSAWNLLQDFKYFEMPLLETSTKNSVRQFFISKFPLFFNSTTSKVLVHPKFRKFIAEPHFVIDKEEDGFYLITKSLRKGFFYPTINGNRVFKKAKLKDGDSIEIGAIKMKFYESLI